MKDNITSQWEKDYALFDNNQHVIFGKKLCGCADHVGYRVLDISEFYPKEGSTSGLQSWCKTCDMERGKKHLKETQNLPSRYKGKDMDFNFELPKFGRPYGHRISTYFIKLTSSSSGLRKGGEIARSFDIYFGNDANKIIEILGDRVAVAFDNTNKKIAIKSDPNGWKISKLSKKHERRQLKIKRTDMWGNIKNIQLTEKSISIIDGVVILDVGNMK